MDWGVESWRGQIPATDGDQADGEPQVLCIFSTSWKIRAEVIPPLNHLLRETRVTFTGISLLRSCQMTSLGCNRGWEMY